MDDATVTCHGQAEKIQKMQYGDFLHRRIGEDSVHLKVFNMYAQQL